MQFVTIQQLKELAKGQGKVVEDEKSFSYEEFKKTHAEVIDRMRAKGYLEPDAIEWSYKNLKNGWLKDHCPPIRYIDEGSSRAAYACSGGKCLKIAINQRGTSQNKTEFENVGVGKGGYSCFAENFDCDHERWGSILTECCTGELDRGTLEKLYGHDDFIYLLTEHVLIWLNEDEFYIDKTIETWSEKLKDLETDVFAGNFTKWRFDEIKDSYDILLSIKKDKNLPQYKVLNDLIDFYVDHGRTDEDLLIEDLATTGNWGMAIRDDAIVPVILDAGFSETVRREYY